MHVRVHTSVVQCILLGTKYAASGGPAVAPQAVLHTLHTLHTSFPNPKKNKKRAKQDAEQQKSIKRNDKKAKRKKSVQSVQSMLAPHGGNESHLRLHTLRTKCAAKYAKYATPTPTRNRLGLVSTQYFRASPKLSDRCPFISGQILQDGA